MSSTLPRVDRSEVFRMLDVLQDDLDPTQINKLEQAVKLLGDITKLTPEKAVEVFSSVGIDLGEIQKKSRRRKAEEKARNKKVKIGPNQKCWCNSNKKFKHCCRFKNLSSDCSTSDVDTTTAGSTSSISNSEPQNMYGAFVTAPDLSTDIPQPQNVYGSFVHSSEITQTPDGSFQESDVYTARTKNS